MVLYLSMELESAIVMQSVSVDGTREGLADAGWVQDLLAGSRRVFGAVSALAQNAVGGLSSKLDHENAGVRKMAVETLGHLSTSELEPHVPKIMRLLEDDDSAVRTAAIETLAVLGGQPHDRDDGRSLLRKLLPAYKILGSLDAKILESHQLQSAAFFDDALNAIQLLGEKESSVRLAAVLSIGRLPPRAVGQHAELLQWLARVDADGQVRKTALDILSRLPASRVLHCIETIEHALDDVDSHVRCLAVKIFGKIAARDVNDDQLTAIIRRLSDSDRYVRAAVRQYLARLESGVLRLHVPDLILLLGHPLPEVRLVTLEVIDKCAWRGLG
jgi:HEAT repeat protein